MIGAGIFGLPGKLDAAVGSFAPLLLLIAGLGVMLIALCYADLASRFESSGGPQLYAGAAFGRFVGFQAGWMLYAARAAALAANANVLSAYAGALWPPLDGPLTIIVTIGAITLVNVVGIRRAVDTLGGMTMIKLAPLLLIGALGLLLAPLPAPTLPDFSAVEGVLLVALYAFVGFEAATIPAGETRDPKRAIPRALLLTVAGVTLLYVVVQLAYSASGIGESDAPLAELAATSAWSGRGIAARHHGNRLRPRQPAECRDVHIPDYLQPRRSGAAPAMVRADFATVRHAGQLDRRGRYNRAGDGAVGDVRHPGGDQHRVPPVRLPRLHCGHPSPRSDGGANSLGSGNPVAGRRGIALPLGSRSIPGRGMEGLRRCSCWPDHFSIL